MCAFVCKCIVSISASVVSHSLSEEMCRLLPAQASQNSEFHLPRKLYPGDTVIDALDNQLNPTLKHIGPVIQQYFEASSHLCNGNLCAVKDGILIQWAKSHTAAMRMHLPNVFPSVCLR